MKLSKTEVDAMQRVITAVQENGHGCYSKEINSKLGFKARKWLKLCVKLGLAQESEVKQGNSVSRYYVLTTAGRFPDAVQRAYELSLRRL